MNLYDVTVSACRGAMTPHVHSVNLGEWLATNHEHRANKKDSAAIMPHGMFLSRRAADLQYSSGLVQVDLDAKDNPYDDWHEGRDPAGITTQDPVLAARLDPVKAGRRLSNYLKVMTLEAQTVARACGKSHLHNLEPEDLCALTVEAAAMAQVPLAGTGWIPGRGGY
jgi:hypothetical protein